MGGGRKHEKSNPQHKPPPSQTTSRRTILLGALAGILMFSSWLAQNIYQSDVGSSKSDALQNVQFVNSEMAKALQWLLAFQAEKRKDKPDPDVLFNTAMSYSSTVGTIVQAASRVDPQSPVLARHVSEYDKLKAALDKAATSKDPKDAKDVAVGASVMMEWFASIGPAAHEAMNSRMVQIDVSESWARWLFRGFFLVGSLLLAYTWWKTQGRLLFSRST